jgi:SecD/SecF fusion protein
MRRGNEAKFTTAFLKKPYSKNTNFNFVGKRKLFYIASSIFILGGMFSMFTKGFSTGVDFKGGWTYTIQFKGDANF